MPHPGLLHPEPLPLRQATADPCLRRRCSDTQRQVWWGLWCTQGFVSAVQAQRIWWVWSLLLNMTFPLLPSCWVFSFDLRCGLSFFWWDPTFSCPWLFSSELYFGVLTGEVEHMSFYSTILSLCIKDLPSMPPPIRTRPCFPHSLFHEEASISLLCLSVRGIEVRWSVS